MEQWHPEISKEFLCLIDSGACDVDLEIVAETLANAYGSARAAANGEARR